MRKVLALITGFFCIIQMYAQSNIVTAEFFVDTDPGFGNGTPITVPNLPNALNVNFSVPVGGLSAGTHFLFLRSRDANGKWSETNSRVFFKPISALPSTIIKAEYFIDTDPGFGKANDINIGPGINIIDTTFSTSIELLSPGIHFIFIRSRDANGKWSVTNSRVFYKPASGTILSIVKAEYFIDTDPGFGKANDIPVAAGTVVTNNTFSAPIDTLATGIHFIFVRSKNASGKWSVTNNFIFFKPRSDIAPAIVKAEYFVDADPGFGNATIIPVSPGVNLSNVPFTLSTATLTEGVHFLFVRSKAADGDWSFGNTIPFVKLKRAPENITNIEYFIDIEPGFGTAVPVAVNPALTIDNFIAPVNISGLSAGNHKLYLRSRGANGYSITNAYEFPISATAPGPYININSIVKKVFCAWDFVRISYDARVTFNTGNVFNAELSDANGVFAANPPIIGSYAGTRSTIIECRLPAHLPDGTNYRIRVSSSNPVVTGVPGNDGLTIHDRPYAQTVTGRTQVNGNFTWPYSIPNVVTSSYAWYITGGSQITGLNTNAGDIKWAQPITPSITGAINIYETNQYGCVGDPGILNPVIYKLHIAPNGADSAHVGSTIVLPTSSDGAFDPGNTYTAELSDQNGGFDTPSLSAVITASGNGVAQSNTINLSVPCSLPGGAGYRVRVRSSNPAFTGDTTSIKIVQPNIGADTAILLSCPGETTNLLLLYTKTGYTYLWNTPAPATAPAGNYRVTGTTIYGCSDTAFVILALETATWTGTVSSDWHVAANWNIGKVPGDVTHVIIAAGTPNNCVLSNSNGSAASIQMRPGASMQTLNNRQVVVKGKCATLPSN
ncbi:MAG: hypothetical protein ABIX01_01070 [Chitinophagaceae bacterium]